MFSRHSPFAAAMWSSPPFVLHYLTYSRHTTRRARTIAQQQRGHPYFPLFLIAASSYMSQGHPRQRLAAMSEAAGRNKEVIWPYVLG